MLQALKPPWKDAVKPTLGWLCQQLVSRFQPSTRGKLAGAAGLEPATGGFGDRCSTKLSYTPAGMGPAEGRPRSASFLPGNAFRHRRIGPDHGALLHTVYYMATDVHSKCLPCRPKSVDSLGAGCSVGVSAGCPGFPAGYQPVRPGYRRGFLVVMSASPLVVPLLGQACPFAPPPLQFRDAFFRLPVGSAPWRVGEPPG